MAKFQIELILKHPDLQEILAKLISGVDVGDINEWLGAKYINVSEKKFILNKKYLTTFKDEYLDIYKTIRDDLATVKSSGLSATEEMNQIIQNNPKYHQKLNEYLEKEIDIKSIIKRMVVAVETRAAQVFDQIQEDPQNIKMDRTLIEWFNTLTSILEKYDVILNGSPDSIAVQNNINIQVLDQHVGVIYNIIREILSKLDYDTSLLFIEMFNDEMKKIKPIEEKPAIPVELRLAEAKELTSTLSSKLDP